VPPMHGPPDAIIGIKLIEEMIVTFVVDKTIGVIHPAYRRHEMIAVTKAQIYLWCLLSNVGICP
jgi:hypothetical protein